MSTYLNLIEFNKLIFAAASLLMNFEVYVAKHTVLITVATIAIS